MSKQEHTPGPWEILRGPRGQTIYSIGPISSDEYAGASWLDISEPDACLIAAAPELLQALTALLELYDSAIHNEYDGTSNVKAILAEADFARAAIVKARGEA